MGSKDMKDFQIFCLGISLMTTKYQLKIISLALTLNRFCVSNLRHCAGWLITSSKQESAEPVSGGTHSMNIMHKYLSVFWI